MRELLRYGIVGVSSNTVLYGCYLLLTYYGMGHKTGATLVYVIGVLQTFLLHRRYTFGSNGSLHDAFVRYLITYLIGYVVSISLLALFVDGLGYPHQYVQAGLVFVIAGLLFSLQKCWVFRKAPSVNAQEGN